jgi:hypothetical protein
LATCAKCSRNSSQGSKTSVGQGKEIMEELQVAQGKVELLILQTTNDWENMAIENKTKTTLYDEFIEQLPIKVDELLEEAKVQEMAFRKNRELQQCP